VYADAKAQRRALSFGKSNKRSPWRTANSAQL
jgi:hypothetical protein